MERLRWSWRSRTPRAASRPRWARCSRAAIPIACSASWRVPSVPTCQPRASAPLGPIAANSQTLAQMAEIDADADGLITCEEMLAVVPGTTEEAFAALDADADGAVDEAELAAAVEAGLVRRS